MAKKVDSLNIFKLLLVVILLKGIVWSFLVPLWHFPDEQAHFGHIALNAEKEFVQRQEGKDLNEEIAVSEKLLGTFRDEHGNNRFTYHPEYNLEYSDSLTGLHEQQIKSLPLSSRYKLVARESAYYPELFYNLSASVYRLFYKANLFIRVFALRLAWLPLLLIMTWVGYRLSQLIFPKDKFLPLVVAITVGFQPMLTFVSSGVSSDNLYNAFFSLAILISALLIVNGFSLPPALGLGVITGLGMNTKPQFLISLAVTLPALIIAVFKKTNRKNCRKIIIGLLLFLTLSFVFGARAQIENFLEEWGRGNLLPFFSPRDKVLLPDYSLIDHFIWTIKHTIREVIPWYWGVFRWLSLTLPRWTNRILNRLLIISALGLIVKLIKIIKHKRFNQSHLLLGFVAYTAFIYFAALFVWDWDFFRSHNFSFGIQGRYYFPVIVPHMILLVVGIQEIVKLFSRKITVYLLPLINYLLSLWFIVLNFVALYTVVNSYYDTSSYKAFIIQASQYKPFFAKGIWLTSALIIYLTLSLILLCWFGRLSITLKHEK